MEMSEKEIVRSYLKAQYKSRQVKILADLNTCSTATIEGIIKKNGIPYPPVKGAKSKAEHEAYEKIMSEELNKQPIITKPLATPKIKKIVPDAVANLVRQRIIDLDCMLQELEEKRKAFLEEAIELREFMGVNENDSDKTNGDITEV